jgi:hypothetical protein
VNAGSFGKIASKARVNPSEVRNISSEVRNISSEARNEASKARKNSRCRTISASI